MGKRENSTHGKYESVGSSIDPMDDGTEPVGGQWTARGRAVEGIVDHMEDRLDPAGKSGADAVETRMYPGENNMESIEGAIEPQEGSTELRETPKRMVSRPKRAV